MTTEIPMYIPQATSQPAPAVSQAYAASQGLAGSAYPNLSSEALRSNLGTWNEANTVMTPNPEQAQMAASTIGSGFRSMVSNPMFLPMLAMLGVAGASAASKRGGGGAAAMLPLVMMMAQQGARPATPAVPT